MKYLKKYKITGDCEINFDAVINDWIRIPHLWEIMQWKNTFRLVRWIRKNCEITSLKVSISNNTARKLITKLDLNRKQSPVFKCACEWII